MTPPYPGGQIGAGGELTIPSVRAINNTLRYDDGGVDVTVDPNAFSSMLATFSARDVGKTLVLCGAGPAGATLVTSILAYVGPHTLTLADAASTTVNAATFVFGTDDSAAIQYAVDALPTMTTGMELLFPNSRRRAYLTTVPIDVGARKITFRLSGGTWYAASTLFSVTEDTPGSTNHDGGCVSIFGCGLEQSKISYLLKSGNLIQQTQINGPKFRHLTIDALAANNTATCFALNSNFNVNISELTIQRFAVCVNLYGEASPDGRGGGFHLVNLQLKQYTLAGIMTSHAVDVHLTNISAYAVVNNPSLGWSLIVDTDTSGVYINTMAMGWGGMVIRNTLSVPGTFGGPPEWVFANNVIADSTSTVGILLDASLRTTGDVDGRGARGFHFINSWAAFSTTDGDDTVRLSGGSDISFTDCRVRVSRRHGFYVDGADNVRIINCLGVANNVGDVTNGAGIYLKSSLINLGVQIIGGRFGDAIESVGKQDWGVYVDATFLGPLTMIGVDLRDNEIGAWSDNGTGERQVIGNMMGTPGTMRDPPTVGDPLGNVNVLSMVKGRFQVGDGAFYADYKESSGPDDVSWFFDLQDCLRYIRAVDRFDFMIANNPLLRLALAGGNSIMIQSRPSAAGGLLNGLLNSSLDTDTGERFNIRGDGRLTWGDGSTVDVVLERAAATLLNLSSDFQTAGKVGAGIAPEAGWNFKTAAAKITTAMRLAYLASAGNVPMLASSLGDVITGPINLAAAAMVTGTLALGNGGTGATTAAGARAALDVYSKAEIDNFLANYYTASSVDGLLANKADKGVQTGTTSGHTHTQN